MSIKLFLFILKYILSSLKKWSKQGYDQGGGVLRREWREKWSLAFLEQLVMSPEWPNILISIKSAPKNVVHFPDAPVQRNRRARISRVCITLVFAPWWCRPSESCIMQPGQPVATTWAPVLSMAADLGALMAMEVS